MHLVCPMSAAEPASARRLDASSYGFSLVSGLKVSLFAREPMLADPVALDVGADGSVYVTQTRRRKTSNLDIRANADWLNHELSFKSVGDKESFYRRTLDPEHSAANIKRVPDHNGDGSHDWRDLEVQGESVHRLIDSDGDGVADRSTVFADGFAGIVTGVAAGVMAHGDDVFVAVAPDLWRLRDTNGDGSADVRQRVASGFGVHIGYAGHDLHGLAMGPDGKVYWSVGDIGADRVPDEGAVFRSNPDGSDFQLFARGLRNPQELAFDDHGNLFTGENDADMGDRERWIHVVEDGDYGWRNHFQYQGSEQWGPLAGTYRMWMDEKMWQPWFPGQAGHALPAVAHIGSGPCGLAYYPGTGLGPAYRNRFFMAHFSGSPANSGINTFLLREKGASFEMVEDKIFLRGLNVTGLGFGPDGALYCADWRGGWDLNNEGAVFRITSDAPDSDRDLPESRSRMERTRFANLTDHPAPELFALFSHPNQHVRLRAQFALATRGRAEAGGLVQMIGDSDLPELSRIHAVWCLGQISRTHGDLLEPVSALLDDPTARPELVVQAARVLGDHRHRPAGPFLVRRVDDPSARVRFAAVMALAKIGFRPGGASILSLLDRVGTSDLYLRHAGVTALTRLLSPGEIRSLDTHASPHVRMAAVLALRRLRNDGVVEFLSDSDPWIRLEAARAINDVPIEAGRAALSDLVSGPIENEWLGRRILNAHFRLGTEANARSLAGFAVRPDAPESLRREALEMLSDWESPNSRDRVTGTWLPLNSARRDLQPVRAALTRVFPDLMAGPESVRSEISRLAGALDMVVDSAVFLAAVKDRSRTASSRVAALDYLAGNRSADLAAAIRSALADPNEAVFGAGLTHLAFTDPAGALEVIDGVLGSDDVSLSRRQAALLGLGRVATGAGTARLSEWLDRLVLGNAPAVLQVELLEAASRNPDPAVQARLQRYRNRVNSGGSLNPFDPALEGGNAERGQRIFFERVDLQCVRCHQARTDSGEIVGGDAAPSLVGLSERQTRAQILESIVQPNRAYAPGYERTTIETADGRFVTGRIVAETESRLELEVPPDDEDAEFGAAADSATARPGERVEIEKSRIARRRREVSAMPEGLDQLLGMRDLRDLVEFLARQ